ncbi:MAG: hypothetical protein ABW019_08230 [Chitinophagaceae bacterium]
MKPVILILPACFACVVGCSQVLRKPVAMAYTGLGAYSLQHADVFSFTANQASLATLKSTTAGVYGERRFLLAALSSYTAAAALPTSSGNFGLKAGYHGSGLYNETQLGLAYARGLGKRVDAGVQFNYNGIRMAGYGNASAISFEAGAVLHLSDLLHAGIHVNNPVGGKFGKAQQEKLPAIYTAGIGYEASELFFISMEVVKEEDQPVTVNAGMQYTFLRVLLARAGVSTGVSSAWLGVGLLWKTFRLDVTASYHPQLGITPGLLLIFQAKPRQE